jgi:hypothetical protein
MALFVQMVIVLARLHGALARRDHAFNLGPRQRLEHARLGVIRLVGDHGLRRLDERR